LYLTAFVAAISATPAWSGAHLGNSNTIVTEAAACISFNQKQNQFVLDPRAVATVQSRVHTPRSTLRSAGHLLESKSQDSFGAAAADPWDNPHTVALATHAFEPGGLALLKSLNK
jgi:hypothetical protein